MDKTNSFKSALGIALKVLVRQSKTVRQIKNKLNNFDDDTVESVIVWLKQRNYINDLRFAESYCRNKKRKKWGGFKIKHRLEELGVSDEIIEKAAGDIDIYEKNAAVTLLEERSIDERNKQIRFLLSRGFKYETVLNAVEAVKSGSTDIIS